VTLPATDGPNICLADLRGRAVLFVYPWTGRPGQPNPPRWDDIPGAHGSTPEIEGFVDRAGAFAALGVALYGLSGQTTDYQREMARRLKVPFPILSDAGGRAARALSLPTFETGNEIYLERLTFVIADGCFEHLFYPVPDPAQHAQEVWLWLERAQPRRASSSASSTE
jgi:peroxiredoxin